MSGLGKLRAFLQDVFAPGLHVAFAGAWVVSLLGSLVLLGGGALRFDLALLGVGLSVLLVLFFLRVVDEVKDEDYDLVHNPDRLLIRGVISHRDLYLWGGAAALLVVGLNLWLAWRVSPWLLGIAVGDMVWAVALVGLEARSPRVREGMVANLLVTYPVNVALSIYVLVFFLSTGGPAGEAGALPLAWEHVALVGAYALAFLHYEVARKTSWPEHSAQERMYSNVLGARGALAVVLLCAFGAAGLCLALFRPWAAGLSLEGLAGWAILGLPALALGAARKLLAEQERRVKLGGLGMIGLTAFYVALTLQALGGADLVWG